MGGRVGDVGPTALQSHVIIAVGAEVIRVIRGIVERVHFENYAVVNASVANAAATSAEDGKSRAGFGGICDGVRFTPGCILDHECDSIGSEAVRRRVCRRKLDGVPESEAIRDILRHRVPHARILAPRTLSQLQRISRAIAFIGINGCGVRVVFDEAETVAPGSAIEAEKHACCGGVGAATCRGLAG